MKYLKKFENFALVSSLPITSQNTLMMYYNCTSCNALYPSFNQISNNCKYCSSKDVKDLDEDTYYTMLKERTEDPEEWKEIITNRKNMQNNMIDIANLDIQNNRKNIN